MDHQKAKRKQRLRRRRHVRRGITGTPERPRLTVFRSSKHIYAQLIDDLAGRTLASASSAVKKAERAGVGYGGNAAAAKAAGVTTVAFDRGHYRYHGRVKALADGAREGGLQF